LLRDCSSVSSLSGEQRESQRPSRTGALSNNVLGVIWALLAGAMFAITAAMAKLAVQDYHVLQILFFRQLVVFASSLPDIRKSFPESLKTRYPLLHLCRLFGAFVALSCGIWAVSVLPLTTATTIGFAQVFFVALLATFFLGESVGRHRIAAIVVGFIGVLVVMRPGVGGLIDVEGLIPLAAACGAAVAISSVRRLSQTESTATLLVYQSVFVGLLAALPLWWLWKTPDLFGLFFLLLMGVVAAVGQWLGVRALRLGEASVVGNAQYMQLVYAAILGFVLFAEVPDRYTIVGAAIIVASALYLLHRESRASVVE